jgi:DNA-binding transcriptional MocR family regulator
VSATPAGLAPSPSVPRPSFAKEEVRIADLAWELLARVTDKGLAPFGIATAAPEHYPSRRLSRILGRVVREAGPAAVVYGSPMGHEALLHQLARRALAAGLAIQPDEIVVTNGCTEAIQLALRALTRPGDVILVESPSYYGFPQTAESLGLRVVEVPTDPETGASLAHLEAAIRRTRPRAFLTNPNFQNPLGFAVPDEVKREQVALLARHEVAIVEDDLYSDLYFGDTRPAPLKAFDTTGNVLLCSSFSKTLAPGFRVGWVAGGRHIGRIRQLKLASSIHTNTLAQLTIAEYLSGGGAEHHFRRLRQAFRAQVAHYAHAVAQLFPVGTRVSRPRGGHLLWIELEPGADTMALARRALTRRVGIVPGRVFSTGDTFAHCFRLNCGFPLRGGLERSLETLAELVREG